MITRKAATFSRHFGVVGQKEIFMPNFLIILLRTPHLSPYYAKFRVPLNINKLDLKDYLFHAYGIQAQHIRSHILQKPVQQNNPRDTRPAPRRWFRPQSVKFMTVQMDRPFVWPAEPEDYSPWDRDTYDAANAEQKRDQDEQHPDARQEPPADKGSLREQAQRLLSGKEKWRPGAKDVRSFGRSIVARLPNGKGVATLKEDRPEQ